MTDSANKVPGGQIFNAIAAAIFAGRGEVHTFKKVDLDAFRQSRDAKEVSGAFISIEEGGGVGPSSLAQMSRSHDADTNYSLATSFVLARAWSKPPARPLRET